MINIDLTRYLGVMSSIGRLLAAVVAGALSLGLLGAMRQPSEQADGLRPVTTRTIPDDLADFNVEVDSKVTRTRP